MTGLRGKLVVPAALVLMLAVEGTADRHTVAWEAVRQARPAPRTAHTMAYHSGLEMVVVFGGRDATGRELGDLWGWDGHSWHLLDDGEDGPPPRARHAMAYDRARNRLVIHGGGTVDADLADTWSWSEQGWRRLAGDGPGPRSHHHMAFDPGSGSIVLYGGGRDDEEFGSDTWILGDGRWRESGERLRPGRVLAGIAAGDGRVFLYGGLVRGEGRMAELWSWRDGRWSLLGAGGPRGLIYPGLAWDRRAGRLVSFGGEGEGGPSGETWLWTESGWRQQEGPGPPARTEHAMAYDAARGVTVVFGGKTPQRPVNDVWEWDGTGWTRADGPPSSEGWVDEIITPQYFAVRVRDLDAAVEWYRTALGLEEWIGSEAEDGSWRIANLRNESLLVELIRDDRARTVDRPHGFMKVGFQVPDVDAIADRIARATGERPRVSEFPRFGLRVLQLHDPEGNIIQLHDDRTTLEGAWAPSGADPCVAYAARSMICGEDGGVGAEVDPR